MSVLCSLFHISGNLLEKVIEMPQILDLLWGIMPMESEDPKIENFYGLPSEYANLLAEICADPQEVIGQLTLEDLEELADWKEEYPEEYDQLKPELYQILIEKKAAKDLYLDRDWDAIDYIFRLSSVSGTQRQFVSWTDDGQIRVEVIQGGKNIDMGHKYLKPSEVQDIAEGLSQITDVILRQRFEQAQKVQPNLYRSNWDEEIYTDFLTCCHELKNFYLEAARQSYGVLISIG